MSIKIISSFPERLRQCLNDNSSLSATILADQIGLSKQAISMYLSGARKPKRPTIKVIADALNVNEAWLIGYDGWKEKPKNNTDMIRKKKEPIPNTVLHKFFIRLKPVSERTALMPFNSI